MKIYGTLLTCSVFYLIKKVFLICLEVKVLVRISVRKKKARPTRLDNVILKLCMSFVMRYRLQHLMAINIPINAAKGLIKIFT